MPRPITNSISRTRVSITAVIVALSASLAFAGEQPLKSGYARALDFAGRGLYPQASSEIRSVNSQQPGNLDAWKMRIWLSAMVNDSRDAMNAMEWLARKMPADDGSHRRDQRIVETAEFCGEVFGFLHKKSGSSSVDYAAENFVRYLNDRHQQSFRSGFDRVATKYDEFSRDVQLLRDQARDEEQIYRQQQLGKLQNERGLTFSEMEKIETLRAAERERGVSERNVQAATRSTTAQDFYGGHRDLAIHQGRFRRDRRIDPVTELPSTDATTPVARRRNALAGRREFRTDGLAIGGSNYGGRYYNTTGLQDRHYADVNRRGDEYEDYLTERQRDLTQQMRRIDKDVARLMRSPNVGSTPYTRDLAKRAQSFATYVAMPVNPDQELARLSTPSSNDFALHAEFIASR